MSKGAVQQLLINVSKSVAEVAEKAASEHPLRPCQTACLQACAEGARVLELACGTGKTRIMWELARNMSGKDLGMKHGRHGFA